MSDGPRVGDNVWIARPTQKDQPNGVITKVVTYQYEVTEIIVTFYDDQVESFEPHDFETYVNTRSGGYWQIGEWGTEPWRKNSTLPEWARYPVGSPEAKVAVIVACSLVEPRLPVIGNRTQAEAGITDSELRKRLSLASLFRSALA